MEISNRRARLLRRITHRVRRDEKLVYPSGHAASLSILTYCARGEINVPTYGVADKANI